MGWRRPLLPFPAPPRPVPCGLRREGRIYVVARLANIAGYSPRHGASQLPQSRHDALHGGLNESFLNLKSFRRAPLIRVITGGTGCGDSFLCAETWRHSMVQNIFDPR